MTLIITLCDIVIKSFLIQILTGGVVFLILVTPQLYKKIAKSKLYPPVRLPQVFQKQSFTWFRIAD